MEYLVPEAKVVDYLLTNTRKSGFFLALGYTAENWIHLRDDLVKLAASFPSSLRRNTPFGDEYEIVGEVRTPRGQTIKLRTGWMIRSDEPDTMIFVTAYPARA